MAGPRRKFRRTGLSSAARYSAVTIAALNARGYSPAASFFREWRLRIAEPERAEYADNEYGRIFWETGS